MVAEAKAIPDLPVKSTAANTDRLVFQSNAAANGGNVATITLSFLTGNSSLFNVGVTDPANTHSWVGPPGVLFFSNTFGYVSIANNFLMRFPISTF
jgi:hypothetical protein